MPSLRISMFSCPHYWKALPGTHPNLYVRQAPTCYLPTPRMRFRKEFARRGGQFRPFLFSEPSQLLNSSTSHQSLLTSHRSALSPQSLPSFANSTFGVCFFSPLTS